MDDGAVSIDAMELITQARTQRNMALDNVEMLTATVNQLKKERAELRAEVAALKEASNGNDTSG